MKAPDARRALLGARARGAALLLVLMVIPACWEGGSTTSPSGAPARVATAADDDGPRVVLDSGAAARKASMTPEELARLASSGSARVASTSVAAISASVVSADVSAALTTTVAAAMAAGTAPTATPIAYAPETGLAKNFGPACDDCVMLDVPIGFTFTYFGKSYSALDISDNGFVRLGADIPEWTRENSSSIVRAIPSDEVASRNEYGVNNLIAVAWSDWDASAEGTIRYETRGAAPNRRFVLQYVGLPESGFDTPTAARVTAQLILREGSNQIEIHTASLTSRSAGGFTRNQTQGVEDAAGAVAAYVTGRVLRPLTLTNDAVRFTTGSVNQPPAASAGGPYAASEGLGVVFTAAASTDPEGGALTYEWDLDEDGQYDDGTGVTASYVYNDDGSHLVAVRVTDAQGACATATALVEVSNVTPAPELGAAVTTVEGLELAGTRSFTDPGADRWTAVVDYGDGSGVQPLSLSGDSFALAHRYADGGSYTITVAVTDDDGAVGTGTLAVTVANVAPTVTGFTAPDELLLGPGGAVGTVTGVQFSDPAYAVDGPFVTTISCGNGQVADAAGRCTYAAGGSYRIAVTVADKDGGVSAPLTREVRVRYSFTGFFQPVENLPYRNIARAGVGIPVHFSLGGDRGLSIFQPGFPSAVETGCDMAVAADRVERQRRTTASELTYSAQRAEYTYMWKTDKAWAGSCRVLVVRFADGSEHRANFQFK
jgi:hypothetical protein